MFRSVKKENNIIVLTLFIGLVAAFSILTSSLINMLEDERSWIEHRRKMELELEGLISSVFEMEATQRGYIITSDTAIKGPYKRAERDAFRHLVNAYPLTLDVEIQQKRLKGLENLLNKRKSLLDKVISLSENDTVINTTQIQPYIIEGDKVMDEIRNLVEKMRDEEQNLLDARLGDAKSYSSGALITAIFLGLTTIVITIYLYRRLHRGTKEKIAAEEEREKAIEYLRQSEIRYRNLHDSSNDGIVIANDKGNIISWNKSAETIFGYTEEEIINQPLDIIMPERFKKKHKEGFERFLNTHQAKIIGNRVELIGRNKKGKEIPIEITLSQWDVDGSYFFSGLIRDITHQKEAQERLNLTLEELKRSNEDLEQFAYVASHDLQEPLRKIRAFGDRLMLKNADTEIEGKEYIDRMVDGAERMQTLITDLLIFSRISRDDSSMKPVDLNEIVNNVLDNLQVTIEETKATVNVEKLPILNKANDTQMGQLFQNLISNAIKFRKKDVPPVVSITVNTIKGQDLNLPNVTPKPGKSYYKITVSDNGIGFDIKYIDKIFTIFQRLHGRNEYKGTGIGLAVCKKICKNHQGFITAISSENGSQFIVIIPKKYKHYDK